MEISVLERKIKDLERYIHRPALVKGSMVDENGLRE
jgi:hypothetical protein